jgi:hypothetical protein
MKGRESMTNFKLLSAAAILAAAFAAPALAEPVISEPGLFAFYHPNGDLGIGSVAAPADAMAMMPRSPVRGMRMQVKAHPKLRAR